jgi:hypothetical protein
MDLTVVVTGPARGIGRDVVRRLRAAADPDPSVDGGYVAAEEHQVPHLPPLRRARRPDRHGLLLLGRAQRFPYDRGPHRLLRDGQERASAFLGITVPGFLNLFVRYGPNTKLLSRLGLRTAR